MVRPVRSSVADRRRWSMTRGPAPPPPAQGDGGASWYDSGPERAQLSKDDLIDIQGLVTAVHSGGLYRVESDTGHEVLAQLSGRMRRFRIKVVPGDRVKVGVSPYDPTRGLITYRER